MIKKGEYIIIDLMCISTSLLKQLNTEDEEINNTYGVYKAVLQSKKEKLVAYFLNNIEIGQSSIIQVKKDLDFPLLYKEDYDIIKQTKYTVNKILIKKLQNKKLIN